MGEKHNKTFGPRPDLRIRPWLMGALADGKIFLKKNFTPLVYVQNDQHIMGIILRYVCWGTH